VPVIASGGAGNALHMGDAFLAGADAALAAGIFHDAATTVADVKRYLHGEGVPVRLT
jgi:cyclase